MKLQIIHFWKLWKKFFFFLLTVYIYHTVWQFKDTVEKRCSSKQPKSSVKVKGVLSLADRILFNTDVSYSYRYSYRSYSDCKTDNKWNKIHWQMTVHDMLIVNLFLHYLLKAGIFEVQADHTNMPIDAQCKYAHPDSKEYYILYVPSNCPDFTCASFCPL